MNKKELKEYLKDNLRLEVCLASSYYGTNDQVITILLENEIICRDTVHIPVPS